jgi:hypothetical protein
MSSTRPSAPHGRHDIGKIAIPGALLTRPGHLDAVEWEFMRQLTIIAGRMPHMAPALAGVPAGPLEPRARGRRGLPRPAGRRGDTARGPNRRRLRRDDVGPSLPARHVRGRGGRRAAPPRPHAVRRRGGRRVPGKLAEPSRESSTIVHAAGFDRSVVSVSANDPVARANDTATIKVSRYLSGQVRRHQPPEKLVVLRPQPDLVVYE